jgi:soluble cytochrome b562
MPMVKARLKLIPILLITAILCAGCDIPDLSEFTKQSAEMTRGIRKGVKDTESVIKTASESTDLFSAATRTRLKKDLKDYRSGMKPTVEALDALDSYLEALNALAQANKKSEENSRAAVNAVTNLVTAVSGLTFASSAVNVASGLVTLAEQFRTSRDFKKRVNLAAVIVEGAYKPKLDSSQNPVLDENGKQILVKACTGKAEEEITVAAGRIKKLVDAAMNGLSDPELKELEPLTPHERREKLKTLNKLSNAQYDQITNAESTIGSFGCGVIDLIKFNVKDLKEINLAISERMLSNAREKNRTVLGFYDSIEKTDRRIQHELETLLNYKTQVVFIKELEATGGSPTNILDAKIVLKTHADDLFVSDAQLKNDIVQALTDCGAACGNFQGFLDFDLCDTCRDPFVVVINGISKPNFDRSNGHIEKVLEDRAAVLSDQNSKYLDELKRITPAHSLVIAELLSMDQKQDQLDQLLGASISALDTWAKTHANLRVAVNTKKPLGVAQLASKVREIWSIIDPEKK